jgi:hypothetical protein
MDRRYWPMFEIIGSCRLSSRSYSNLDLNDRGIISCPVNCSNSPHTLELIIQPNMSQYPFSEITDPMRGDPCCSQPPSLQLTDSPSPELFDQECDNNEEFGEFDLPADEIDALFSSHRNTNPIINTKISTLSGFTDSTDSSYEIASSQYSYDITSSESDYLNPEFENYYSANNELQAFIPSDGFADPLPYVPAESHGTINFTPNFPADGSSTVMHQLESVTCVNPAALTAHMISDVEAQIPPFKLECPHSPFRKSEHKCICNWLTPPPSFGA